MPRLTRRLLRLFYLLPAASPARQRPAANLTGSSNVMRSGEIRSGGSGKGLALLNTWSASLSKSRMPEPRVTRAASTRPSRLMENCTTTVPSRTGHRLPASGCCRCRARCQERSLSQYDGVNVCAITVLAARYITATAVAPRGPSRRNARIQPGHVKYEMNSTMPLPRTLA